MKAKLSKKINGLKKIKKPKKKTKKATKSSKEEDFLSNPEAWGTAEEGPVG